MFMGSSFVPPLLNWYGKNARDLPWRECSDPYPVWISEVMLQQTRVETVTPYFERWMTRFPTLESLAVASQQEVLNAWEGLGYYSRARNLHRAAKIVMDEFDGQFPKDVAGLRNLPGIGRYTAAAIASIAYGLDEPALDGNIRRVLARLFDVTEPVRSPAGERRLWALVAEYLPPGKADYYNQALMDLGALVCTPRSPDCTKCPVADFCQALAKGVQDQRPVSKPKAPVPHHIVTAAVIQRNGQVLIAQRPPDGLLGGLWEFPGGTQEADEDLPTCLRREIIEELGVEVQVGSHFGTYQHAYTHFRVTLHAYFCTLQDKEPECLEHSELRWIDLSDLDDYPMGKIDRQISNHLTHHG